jgi:hypothetical protein
MTRKMVYAYYMLKPFSATIPHFRAGAIVICERAIAKNRYPGFEPLLFLISFLR